MTWSPFGEQPKQGREAVDKQARIEELRQLRRSQGLLPWEARELSQLMGVAGNADGAQGQAAEAEPDMNALLRGDR